MVVSVLNHHSISWLIIIHPFVFTSAHVLFLVKQSFLTEKLEGATKTYSNVLLLLHKLELLLHSLELLWGNVFETVWSLLGCFEPPSFLEEALAW